MHIRTCSEKFIRLFIKRIRACTILKLRIKLSCFQGKLHGACWYVPDRKSDHLANQTQIFVLEN